MFQFFSSWDRKGFIEEKLFLLNFFFFFFFSGVAAIAGAVQGIQQYLFVMPQASKAGVAREKGLQFLNPRATTRVIEKTHK